MPEERPSDPLLSSPALLLLPACDSHAIVLNWSRSLVLRIRRIAAVAPGLVLRILLISPRKFASSSSRIARHVGHLSKTCRTVTGPSSHAQRLLHTPGTLLSYRKFDNPIFPVRSCVSTFNTVVHIFDEKSVSEAKEKASPEEIFAGMHWEPPIPTSACRRNYAAEL
jgi:hypothetical protein